MEYTSDQFKLIIKLGILGSDVYKSINILNIPTEAEAQFIEDFKNPEHPVYKEYKKGVDTGNFAIDSKLFDEAKSGNVEAARELQLRKDQREADNLKQELFGV